jgi:hypothetical protein
MDSSQALRTPTAESALHLLLDELEGRLEEADAFYAEAQWRHHLGRTNPDELGKLELARSALLLDKRVRETLSRWNGRSRNTSLARRATLLYRRFRWAEIESLPEIYGLRNRIDRTMVAFCPYDVQRGKMVSRAERNDTLRRHPDRARRRDAWLATASLSAQVEDDVRELMRRRGRMARELGYDGFVSWSLDVLGLSRSWVEALFDDLCHLTDAPYRAWLVESARQLSLEGGLRPWDLAFAVEKTTALPDEAFPRDGLLPAARSVADGLGLGKEAAGVRVDTADVPYAALCYAVRPPDDVRILLNPRDGHFYYRVLFHEFGHALHRRCLRTASPALRHESPLFDEAMACLWERLAWEPDWLVGHNGIPADHTSDLKGFWARRMVYRLRMLMAQAVFEYRAYEDLDGDLLKLYQDTCGEYLGVSFDQAPGWAGSPFWTSHPMYLQNYVVAEVVASQTLVALRRRFGRLIGEPEVGAWLAENYYAPGGLLAWSDKIVRATGAPLSSADLISELTSG